ncbi:2OG-Fe(II) oxygenase [Sphingomonas sp. G124]|uniref:2OG-Fe(II) oxygenase n=1 Tax=Sphingomonas cremea TaxID=2904799 RepID=A0A9X1TXG0_9SPHN|nr:2OG-Fe(II) oxygenase [Sphingomonas cremea]MCF2514103.1 2OG-Fe(II) oxygenase [Sphingomonas cremea]
MTSNVVEEAQRLFHSGQPQRAMDLLGQAASRNDPGALEYLANLCLAGKIVNRDLPLSRDLFHRAAIAGSETAAAIYRAFMASGTGGPADWNKAIELLELASRSDPEAGRELQLISEMRLSSEGDPLGTFSADRISNSPDVVMYRSLFTDAECDFLIARAMPGMVPSTVVDPQTGELVPNPIRTSDATGFPLVSESPAIHALCRRLAAASGTHVKQGEPLQILRYRPGQEYRAHFDAIGNADNQRVLTFLVYLNDDFEGGETHFAKPDIKVKGRKGDGLLFRNADADGRPDLNSQHSGLPVTAGEKFLASRWIRERPLQY